MKLQGKSESNLGHTGGGCEETGGWVQRQTDATARFEGEAFIIEEGSLGDLVMEERGHMNVAEMGLVAHILFLASQGVCL